MSAVRGGSPVPLGAPKQRALLAYLLLHANRVVSRTRLVDALWGDDPPARAANALQVYVHGLRRALGAERIETRGDGYELRVVDGELDLDRFETLLAAGQPHAALALWRGAPLSGVGEAAFVRDEAARLEELRLGALEHRLELDLAAGGAAELLGELQALIAAHPFRERLRALLMTALYRAGRQADALAAYRAARRVFLDELGIEPGPELRELEGRILRQDPLLLAPSRAGLPAPATSFVGRQAEVGEVTALLARPGVRLVTLTGPGGAGKTRLALEAAGRFPGASAFVDLAPLPDASMVLDAIATGLAVAARGDRPLLDDVKEHLRAAPLLLVLDNFEHLLDGAPLVGELLRAAPALRVLVTSRAVLRLSGEHEYAVPPLAEEDAVQLFVERARAVEPGFARGGAPAAVAQICRRLDALPLAIELAAARAKLFSADALLARLERRLPLAAGPVDAPERHRTLQATLDWSHGLLPPAGQRALRRLGVFAGEFEVEAAEVVADAGVDELDALAGHSLLRRAGGDRLGLLETIRAYALERLAQSGEEEETRRRHADWFVALAEQSQQVAYGGDQAGWWDRLEHSHDDLRAAIAWAAARGEIERELRLVAPLWTFWTAHGHLAEGRRWLDDALVRAGDAPPELRAETAAAAGALAYRQGDWEHAGRCFQQALDLFQGLGDDVGTARMLGELGNLAVSLGEHELALERYERARADFRRLGLDARVAKVTANMGAVANIQRDYRRGCRLLREALALQRAQGERNGAAISLHNLARAELHLGHREEGARLLAEALREGTDLGYREIIAYCLEGLGELALAQGDCERSAVLVGAGGALFAELGVALASDDAETYEAALAALRRRLGADGLEARLAEGAVLPLPDAVALALEVSELR